MRILLCGNFGGRALQAPYYNTDNKLRNGLVRAGHHVLSIDERARAHDLAPMGLKAVGRRRLQWEVLATAAHYRPDVALFGHTDLVEDETYADLRRQHPGLRLATFFVDPFTTRQATVERLRDRAVHMDIVFATTADASVMAPWAAQPGQFHFMPYPIDCGIEIERADQVPAAELACDGIFLGSDTGTRGAQLDDLRQRLDATFRLHIGGRQQTGDRLSSTTFVTTLASAAMCPQLPLDDRAKPPTPRLYTSARIAQTMGHGVLALTPTSGGFEALYEDGIVNFGSRDELAAEMTELHEDDARRQHVAGLGRRLAHERTAAERVVRYMIDVLFERPPAEAYEWPTEPIC